MSIELKGFESAINALDETLSADQIEKALIKACLLVERSAKQKAHAIRDTGLLSNTISHEVEDGVGIVYSPLEYAPYVEYGTGLFAEDGGRVDVPWRYKDDEGEWHTTSGQHPQPFMRPALDENKDKILKILKEGITGNG